MTFQEANQIIHPVETQWHYPIMIAAGFISLTKEGVGFVRSYEYEKEDLKVTCTTGSSSDYWFSNKGSHGYHGTLKNYVEQN